MQAPWLMLGFALVVSACRPAPPPELPVTRVARPPTPVASGEPSCVDPVAHAERINDLLDASGRPIQAPTTQVMDLDGDGAPDWVLAADRDATTTRFELYVRRPNGCGRYVGGARLSGAIVGTLGKTSHGLTILEVVEPCRHEETCVHHELRYDGIGWVLGDRWTVPRPSASAR